METVIAGGIVAVAGLWFFRWVRASAQGKRGCSGCGGCSRQECAERK